MNCDIDFNKDGIQYSEFSIACSRNESAWGVIATPVVHFKKGTGKTLLLTAGAHGDEFEGPVILRRLINNLPNIKDFSGTLIIIPQLNMTALAASQRLSPIDGRDLNRSFDANIKSFSGSIASFLMDHLISRADIVLDFHSGGRSLDFAPMIIRHQLKDQVIEKQTDDALRAFNCPNELILEEIDAKGMLDSYVEGLGKIFLTTELRGAARVDPFGVSAGLSGIYKLMKHFDMIPSLTPYEKIVQNYSTNRYEVPSESYFARASIKGFYEPLYKIGDQVSQGDVLALIHDVNDLSRSCEVLAKESGTILASRPIAASDVGDMLFMIARKI